MVNDTDIIAYKQGLAVAAAHYRALMVREYPIIKTNPGLEVEVDARIERCIDKFNPATGPLEHYIRSSVARLVHGYRSMTSIALDESAHLSLDFGHMHINSALHSAEVMMGHLSDLEQVQVRVMKTVKDPAQRELIFDVAPDECVELERGLATKLAQARVAV